MNETDPSKSLRVLFVNRMASLERGGGETFDLEISRHLEKLGCVVSYLSGIPVIGGPRTPIRHPRSHLLRTPFTGWFPWDKVRGGWRLRVWDFKTFEGAAARWILDRQDEFDVIQVCELPFLVARLKDGGCRLPVVIRLTAPNQYDPVGGVARADAVIASGTSIARLRAGPRPDCVDVPNAVDIDLFRPHASPLRARLGVPADAFVLLYVARFQAFKNHAMLLDAFARFRAGLPAGAATRLLLAGSGPLRARCEARAAELGIAADVIFLGEVPFADLPDVYAAADIKVITSDYESFCFAAIEAMATGLPVVTTDCGWVPNLVRKGEGGWIAPVGDADAFAAALREAWAKPEERRARGLSNRRTAEERHTWNRSAQLLLDLYRRLTGGGA